VLRARGLVKRFGEREALRGVSLEVGRGEVVAVIGPNGAGKTTLLSILAAAQPPSAGAVECEGRPGWVPQQPAVYSKLTVSENLRLFARLGGVSDRERAVGDMLVQSGLRERSNEQLGRLSEGNRQRVNIAVGLLAAPPVLILDEPSSSLDPSQRERLWEFLDDRTGEGTSVVFSTHNVLEAERHAARVLVLAEGEVLFEGAPGALVADAYADFEAAFLAFLRREGR
jgi:ABC-2 type transport system ATP-binding protein